ncbi:MAG: 1-acyl-sn-glycerol-3-phosphate acyltransferase [Planctomycetes bacterium]|nr:1-acyl-sn-glycerol-3-phosphate acyltransferase [Planctomycetota bacterium]
MDPDEGPPRTYRSLVYHMIMALVHTFAVWPFPMTIRGRENLPKGQGALIVSNHASFLDIPFVAKAGGRRHVCFVARESLAKNRLLGFIMRSCGAVLIDPKAGDRKALKRVVEHLRAGDLVAMFAEGTRSKDGKLLPFKRGALLAARQAKVPVVPCALIGSHHALGRTMKWPRPARVELRLGPLIDPQGEQALDQVRAWIEAQLEGTDQASDRPSPETVSPG